MALQPVQMKWLRWFATEAVRAEKEFGYWAENSVASAALESGWGQKSIKEGNNPFGITYHPSLHRGFVWVPTFEDITRAQFDKFHPDEKATATLPDKSPVPPTWMGIKRIYMRRRFAKFDSVLEALDSKIMMIKRMPQYKFAQAKDWRQMAQFLEDGGYATSKDAQGRPNYARTLWSIGSSKEVTEAIAAARNSQNA